MNRTLAYWRGRRSHGPAVDPQRVDDLLTRLEDPRSDLSRRWDADHDDFILRRLLELIEPDFTATAWRAFRALALEGRDAATVAAELGVTPNAVLIAKSRVLRRLRTEAEGLVE
jgi:RNA polymerase sigma-70 factor (ECF subfamily)